MNRLLDKIPFVNKYISGKIALSLLMFTLSAILFAVFRSFDRAVCVFAMLFSFIGDYTLNHNRDHSKQTKNEFIIGGIAFIVAHIFYSVAYGSLIVKNGFAFFNFGAFLTVVILSMISIFMFIKTENTVHSKLFYFGLAYLWITGINYCAIFSYAISAKSYAYLAMAGGLMFLASDVIIGMEKFLDLKSPIARELVWWLYPIGQILLIVMA